MKTLDLDLRLFGSREYIASDNNARATWLQLLAYCAEEENGGRIAGALNFSDTLWGLMGVTVDAVNRANWLITFEGDSAVVFGYPVEQESVIKAKRTGGKKGADARYVNNPRTPTRSPTSTPSGTPTGTPTETDELWLAGLKNDEAYRGINIAIEHAKCARWCQANKKVLSRRRFINWLNKAERPLNGPLNGALMR